MNYIRKYQHRASLFLWGHLWWVFCGAGWM